MSTSPHESSVRENLTSVALETGGDQGGIHEPVLAKHFFPEGVSPRQRYKPVFSSAAHLRQGLREGMPFSAIVQELLQGNDREVWESAMTPFLFLRPGPELLHGELYWEDVRRMEYAPADLLLLADDKHDRAFLPSERKAICEWLLSAALQKFDPERAKRFGGQHEMHSFQLLTYNIWGLTNLPFFGAQDRSRFEAIAQEIAQVQCDVVCFQEAWDRHTEKIFQQPSMPHVVRADRRFGIFGKSGLVTISRYPVVESAFRAFSTTTGVERFVRKGVLHTRLDAGPIGLIDVYNLHLVSPLEGVNECLASKQAIEHVRAQQLAELESWIKSRTEPGIPVLIAGDFNCHQGEALYKELQAIGFDTYNEKNCSALEEDTRRGATFDPEKNPLAIVDPLLRGEDTYRRRRLDYIFARGIAEQGILFRSNMFFTEPKWRGKPLSDHYGVQLEMLVPAKH